MSTMDDDNEINDEFTGAQKTVIILALIGVVLLVIACYVYMYAVTRLVNRMLNWRVQWSRQNRGRRTSDDDEDRLDIDFHFNTRGEVSSTTSV